MVKVLIIHSGQASAYAYYRGLGVISWIKKLKDGTPVQVEAKTQLSWLDLCGTDILFLDAPSSQAHLDIMRAAKSAHIPIWIDWDDDIFSLDHSNQRIAYWGAPETVSRLQAICHLADTITVTTKNLLPVFKRFNPNVYVVPNAFNDKFHALQFGFSQNKILHWRGSDTHERDLYEVEPLIIDFMKKNPDWNFVSTGHLLWRVRDQLQGRYRHFPAMDILEYMGHLTFVAPAIQIAPLSENQFNLCKSNIAWMEGVFAGATCFAPKLPEFVVPGCVNYTCYEDFADQLQAIADDSKLRFDLYKESFDYITKNLLLSKVNGLRQDIIKNLLEGKF